MVVFLWMNKKLPLIFPFPQSKLLSRPGLVLKYQVGKSGQCAKVENPNGMMKQCILTLMTLGEACLINLGNSDTGIPLVSSK